MPSSLCSSSQHKLLAILDRKHNLLSHHPERLVTWNYDLVEARVASHQVLAVHIATKRQVERWVKSVQRNPVAPGAELRRAKKVRIFNEGRAKRERERASQTNWVGLA